jgi:IS5 family transposase
MGEERLMALLQESLAAATRLGATKPADFRAVPWRSWLFSLQR